MAETAPATAAKTDAAPSTEQESQQVFINTADAPACTDCGAIMTRNGNCYVCRTCGTTSGCS